MRVLLILAAVVLSSEASAASLFKCVDAAGKVTFVQNANCPANTGLADVVNAHNAAPSGSSAPVQLADPSKLQARPKKSQGQSFTVVGERPEPVAAPVVKSEPAPVTVARPANQPCIKLVERLVRCKSPTGGGCSQIIKVPVAC